MKRAVTAIVIGGTLLVASVRADEQDKAHRQLVTLINELQYVRSLISEYKEINQQDARYVFRYDLLDRRLLEIVKGIERHMAASNRQEKLYRLLQE